MNRIIKFRAWDKEAKKWLDHNEWLGVIPIKATILGLPSICEIGSGDYDVQQFTGLTDKNGVDIYEGDIIKNTRGAIRIVFWDNEMASWYTKSNTDEFLPVSLRIAMTNSSKDVNFLEVIGNVFSNPELLT